MCILADWIADLGILFLYIYISAMITMAEKIYGHPFVLFISACIMHLCYNNEFIHY